MAKRKRSKSKQKHNANTNNDNDNTDKQKNYYYDLMVLLPKTKSALEAQLILKPIIQRLIRTKFTHLALTHVIYGKPKVETDSVEKAIPDSLWQFNNNNNNNNITQSLLLSNNGNTTDTKEEYQKATVNNNVSNSRVYKRLHSIMENVSDMSAFVKPNTTAAMKPDPIATLFQDYDIISVAPQNEAVFQSICASNTTNVKSSSSSSTSLTIIDVITLDYTIGRGSRLPFRIKMSDMKSAIASNIAFEIPLSPALLNVKYRKALIQTCRDFQNATLGLKPLLLFSSGNRNYIDNDNNNNAQGNKNDNNSNDAGELALRTPHDLQNWIEIVLGFDTITARNGISSNVCNAIIMHSIRRRFGNNNDNNMTIVDIYQQEFTNDVDNDNNNMKQDNSINNDNDNRKMAATSKMTTNSDNNNTTNDIQNENGNNNDDDDDDDSSESPVEDGFIAF